MSQEVAIPLEELTEGDLCEFTYKRQSGNYRWYEWSCRAVYVGESGYIKGEIDLSFRPFGGTGHIPKDNIVMITRLVPAHERRPGRGYQESSRMIRLPTRKKGAITA